MGNTIAPLSIKLLESYSRTSYVIRCGSLRLRHPGDMDVGWTSAQSFVEGDTSVIDTA